MFSLWTVSPDEGQGPEGHNVAMGGASCIHTRPPTCWPPCRRSRPPASGRPEGKGVLRQMVQHVLLALFLGAGAAGQRLFSLFSLFLFLGFSKHLMGHSHKPAVWSSVGAQLSGDVPQLPEKDWHGRAATCRFWRGGRRRQEHKEEEQRPPLCPHGRGVSPLRSQDGMVDDPPHAQPQVRHTHNWINAVQLKFGTLFSSVFLFPTALTKRIMCITWLNGETCRMTSRPGRVRTWTSQSLTPSNRRTGITGWHKYTHTHSRHTLFVYFKYKSNICRSLSHF